MESIAFRGQSCRQLLLAQLSGLVLNVCSGCDGEGVRGYVDGHCNDPDARTSVDECDECGGTGNGRCSSCGDSSTPFSVAGDGRCQECVAHAAVESAEEEEPAQWAPTFDEHSSYGGAA